MKIRYAIILALMPLLVLAGAVVAQVTTQPPSTIQGQVVTGLSQTPSYSAAAVALQNVAASDLYCVTGSDTKLVKIKRFCVSATATNTATIDLTVVLRSTLNTGGGLASVPVVKMDQLNSAATAVVNTFTSAPTLGTEIGTIRAYRAQIISSGQGAQSTGNCTAAFPFTENWGQPITLRGSTQAACVRTTALGTGATWDISHEHTEE